MLNVLAKKYKTPKGHRDWEVLDISVTMLVAKVSQAALATSVSSGPLP